MELNFHLYGPTNEGLAVPKQSADICHFYEKGIILMCMTSESPLQGHVFSSVLIPPLLIKIGELKKVCISLWIKHIFELAWSKMFSDVLRPFSRRSTVFYRSPSGSTQNMWEGLGKPGMEYSICALTTGVFSHMFRLISPKIPPDGCSVILRMFKYVEDLADLLDACVDLCSRPLGSADQTPSSHWTKEFEIND